MQNIYERKWGNEICLEIATWRKNVDHTSRFNGHFLSSFFTFVSFRSTSKMAVHQGSNERGRRPSNPALLRFNIPDRNQGWSGQFRRRQTNRSSLQDHENSPHIQAGQTLDWSPVHRFHCPEQLQRAWSPHSVHLHGSPHIFQSVLLRGEGRGGHGFYKHSRLVLVGSHHHDNRGLWWYFAHNWTGKISR